MKIIKFGRSEKAQSFVEMALSLFFLLMLTLGAVEIGRLFFAYSVLDNAVQEGAQCGAWAYVDVKPGDPENAIKAKIRACVKDSVITGFGSDITQNLSDGDIAVSYSGSDCDRILEVKVNYTFDIRVPFISAIAETVPLEVIANRLIIDNDAGCIN